MPLPPPLDPAEFETVLGSALEAFTAAVSAAGGTVRVVSVDGHPRPVTLDYSPTRVNVAVSGPTSVVVQIVGVG